MESKIRFDVLAKIDLLKWSKTYKWYFNGALIEEYHSENLFLTFMNGQMFVCRRILNGDWQYFETLIKIIDYLNKEIESFV